jgi:hypothetical protein
MAAPLPTVPDKYENSNIEELMSDVIYIAATFGFFVIAIAYTYACGRL